MVDNVNSPMHYQSANGIECIDAVEAATEKLVGGEAVATGNAIKYLWRWKDKGGVEDLKKSRWYINRLIDALDEDDMTDDDELEEDEWEGYDCANDGEFRGCAECKHNGTPICVESGCEDGCCGIDCGTCQWEAKEEASHERKSCFNCKYSVREDTHTRWCLHFGQFVENPVDRECWAK